MLSKQYDCVIIFRGVKLMPIVNKCMICLEKHNALWKNEGSPRQGLLFAMKNRAKAMRFIRRNEDALRKETLAKKRLCKNDKAFWKEIKLMNNSNLSLPNVVDGITGSNNIVHNYVEISL